MHGPLLISGLGIIALAELLGLVYMKCVGKSALFLLAYARNFKYTIWIMLLVDSYCLGPKKCMSNSKNEKTQQMPLYFLIQTSYLICMHERRKKKRQDKETGKYA